MKPPPIPLEKITALEPVYRLVIPNDYLDENGHMNMRWYLAVYDDAGYPLAQRLGLTPEFHAQHGSGGFDLEHHIHYLSEVMAGDEVVIYARLLDFHTKRIHYMMFMVNQTRGRLASIFECVNAFADLRVRRTAPYPPQIAARIAELHAQHQRLDWPAPVCGVMGTG